MSTNSIEEFVWGLLPLSLMLLGGVILWYASWRQQRRSNASPFFRRDFLTILGWVVLMAGIISVTVTTSLFMSPVVLIAITVVFVSGGLRYWRSDTRYLIWSLAEAARRGIPLEQAARAFASERGGVLAARAHSLAEYLEAAMPLSLAMTRSRLPVSPEIKFAADVGEKTGTLGPSLQKAVQQSNAFDNTLGAILAKFFYLSTIVFVMVGIVTFMMIKIIPTFEQMFDEFGLALPHVTQLLITASNLIVNYWFLLLPVIALLTGGVIIGLLVFVGVPLQSLPIVRHLFSSIDNATVLNSMSIAVKQRQPIPDNLWILSELAHGSRSRYKLGMAVRRIESGMHWTDALQHSGLISKAQNGVIRAAERTGNLAWALDEMADTTVRRTAHRAQAALNFLFPSCLIGFGICILFVAVGMLAPLFSLIGSLA